MYEYIGEDGLDRDIDVVFFFVVVSDIGFECECFENYVCNRGECSDVE